MLQRENPDDYVVATGNTYSLRDFVSEAFEAAGLDWQEHVDVDTSLLRPTDVEYSVGNPKKAEKELRWKAQIKGGVLIRKLVEAEFAKSASLAGTP
jgi:GDPmannose 4,6-dehydratase